MMLVDAGTRVPLAPIGGERSGLRQTEQMEQVTIKADHASLDGTLVLPEDPIGVVLFAHGSGSSRLSPRNNYVAEELRRVSVGTLLLDLLTQQEDQIYSTRFDIALLTARLVAAIAWLGQHDGSRGLPMGLFGASTGAAAALQAAARPDVNIAAVVSRGGRPDMAGQQALQQVRAPTLLIVGGRDDAVLVLNRAALSWLRCEKQLEIVPGATHLFEEPGKLEAVAALAAAWFKCHLAR